MCKNKNKSVIKLLLSLIVVSAMFFCVSYSYANVEVCSYPSSGTGNLVVNKNSSLPLYVPVDTAFYFHCFGLRCQNV